MKLISKIADIDGEIQELVHESKLPVLNKLLDKSNDLYIKRIAELEKELESALYFNIDVIRCLSRIAWEHNHDEIPAYMELSKKCIEVIESKQFTALKDKS
jgi:hypothetical protein